MVLNIVINALLLRRLGAVGAAWASVASNGLLFFGALYMSNRRVTGMETKKILNSIWRVVAASGLMGFSVWYGQGKLPLLVLILIGIIIYPLAIFAFRAVTWNEAKSLVGVLLRRGKGVSDLSTT